jgi:hypothetical protein
LNFLDLVSFGNKPFIYIYIYIYLYIYICHVTIRHAATWHYWAHTSVSAPSQSAVYRGRWPYVWTSALNWYKIQFFFGMLQWLCLILNPSQTQFDGPQRCKDVSPTYSAPKKNLSFAPPPPPNHLTEFGHGVFPSSVYICNLSTVWPNDGCDYGS